MLKYAGLAVVLLVVLLVAPAASPVQLSYVSSDSMAPTIETNDGYVLVPAGTVAPGDIITFYSAERETYVTHRAVKVTDDGIVTKGDGNPSTDQAAGYPLVQRSDVTGEVLTLGDGPFLVPHLGTALSLLRTHWYAVVALLAGALVFSAARSSRPRGRETVLRSREVVRPAMVVAVLVGVVLVSMAAVHQTQTYQVRDADTSDPTALPVGEPQTESLLVRLASTPVTHLVTDTDGMRIVETAPADASPGRNAVGRGDGLDWIRQRLLESSIQNVTVAIPPQATAGVHTTSLDVYPYPATLPRGVVVALHGVHPLLAALTTVLVGVGPFYLCYWALVDPVAPLRSTRHRVLRRLGGGR
jgi:signal peptidase